MIGATTLHGLLNKKEGLGYGYLYNWYAANDANFAPTDWRLASQTELEGLSITTPLSGRRDDSGTFNDSESLLHIWSNTIFNASSGVSVVFDSGGYNTTQARNKRNGFAGKLIYIGSGTPNSTISDNDGNIYDVINVSGSYFTSQNWKCTTLNNGTALTKVTDATAWGNLTTEGYCAYDNNESNV